MRSALVAATLSLGQLLITPAAAQVIRTVAGGMPDDLPALSSNLFAPSDVVVDASGNFYVASGLQARIFKVDPQGHLTRYAGSGIGSFSDVELPALQATFFGLRSLAIDATGTIYTLETGGSDERGEVGFAGIKRIDTVTGIVSPIALLRGHSGFFGVGSVPGGIAVDTAGNLYFTQPGQAGGIYRWDATTHTTTQVAGGGLDSGEGVLPLQAQVCDPADVALDAAGTVYFIEECARARVRRIDPADGRVYTVVGGGFFTGEDIPAAAASLASGTDAIAFDGAGDLLVTETRSHRLRRVDSGTGLIHTVAGSGVGGWSGDGGPALSGRLAFPASIAFDSSGGYLIADRGNNRIRHVDGADVITTLAGNGNYGANGEGGPAVKASLIGPSEVESDADGNLIVMDNGAIRLVARATGIIRTLGVVPSAGQIAVDSGGNVYVADAGFDANQGTNKILRMDAITGAVTTAAGGGNDSDGDGKLATEVFLHVPSGVAVDRAGNLYISQYYYTRIRRVDADTGIITTIAGDPQHPELGGDGGPARQAYLNHPTHLVVDADGNIYVRDSGNLRIRRIDAATGIITTFAGGGTDSTSDGIPATSAAISALGNLDVDSTGNLHLVDGARVRRVDASTGSIATVAGNGIFTSSGDGGPPLDASIAPSGIVLTPFDSLVISEAGPGRVRAVSQCTADVTPPQISVTTLPKVLRHTNHKLVPVRAFVTASDDCDTPLVRLVSITSNEPDDAPGNDDGKTSNDIQGADFGTADFDFLLRAERAHTGTGRVYTVTYSAEDEAGHVVQAAVTITVGSASRLVSAAAR